MVSHRCKMLVIDILSKLEIEYLKVDLGEIEITNKLSLIQIESIRLALLNSGLELMNNKSAILIESIKTMVIELIHHKDLIETSHFPTYIENKLNRNYAYLSNLFSITEGRTLEQFIIVHKIERVKELIMYNELNLTEIAYKLQYSSVVEK